MSTSETSITSNNIASTQQLSSFNYNNVNNDINELNENNNSLYDDCFNISFSQPAIPTFTSHFNKVFFISKFVQ